MENHIPFVLNDQQLKKFESLKITEKESLEIEQSTRDQSRDPKWHKLRQSRITASSAGEIAKRRADGSKLAERLITVRHVQTAAMKRGLEFESTAAQKYSKVMDDGVNLYPSGAVIRPYCHWMAATPDRKVYCPSRNPPYSLLEIKCPSCEALSDVKCLKRTDDALHLKKNDNYYYSNTHGCYRGRMVCLFHLAR